MKVAVSIPDLLFVEAERLAAQLGVSRSRLYAEALLEYLRTRGATHVRERLDAVYAMQPSQIGESLLAAQLGRDVREAW